jgi:hypothetical protein
MYNMITVKGQANTEGQSMELLTAEIKVQLQKQYQMGSDMEQMVVCKFFNPCGSWSWFAMNFDGDDYIWGIVDGFEVEMGSFSLSELQAYKGPLNIGIERDLQFKPITAKELWERLMRGEHV